MIHEILSEVVYVMVFGVKAGAGSAPSPPSVDNILEDLQVKINFRGRRSGEENQVGWSTGKRIYMKGLLTVEQRVDFEKIYCGTFGRKIVF